MKNKEVVAPHQGFIFHARALRVGIPSMYYKTQVFIIKIPHTGDTKSFVRLVAPIPLTSEKMLEKKRKKKFMCHMSRVICHLSRVACHLSHITNDNSYRN